MQEPRPGGVRVPLWLLVALPILLVVVVVIAAAAVIYVSRGDDETAASPVTSTPVLTLPTGTTLPAPPQRPATVSCSYLPSPFPGQKATDSPKTDGVPANKTGIGYEMATGQGPIGLLLNSAESPCTVNSFTSLAAQHYFDGTNCHRLTTSEGLKVLQCGDPTGTGTGGPGYQFDDEYPVDSYSGLTDPTLVTPIIYPRGTLAMANAGPFTNGSQFFLVYADSELPPAYTVFGTVDAPGMSILDRVAAAGVAGGGSDGTPSLAVQINSIAAK
ncbi:peptidylprolyl isomerase [Nocardia sp. NPDC056000]|uniref:peptidylprolyl isomerase n=1 Tax=Nocardia sp. NPDC056000 TaxID=3345674 RepID=UPI0035DB7267